MGRHGHSTTIGKFAKRDEDRRRSEIRMLGERIRTESPTAAQPVADRLIAHLSPVRGTAPVATARPAPPCRHHPR